MISHNRNPSKTKKFVETKKQSKIPSANHQVLSQDLPKRSLEDSLKVPKVILENYGKNGATWEQIAKALGLSANNPRNKYILWSANSYGIVIKEDHTTYKVSETGRKILARTYDGEDREGIIKAISAPSILARFYSDYGSSLLPQGDIFKNVLEQKYEIPKNRVEETIDLILANARFAKILNEHTDGRLGLISLNSVVGVGTDVENTQPVTSGDSDESLTPPNESTTEYSKSCFIITPIGDEDSAERKHADAMLRHLISPVLTQFQIIAIRADKIGKPGHMTKQMVEHIAFCKLCITDISFGNQNAHYELGIRHTLKLPSIQIVRKGDKIPFDIQQGRTIIIDTADPYTIMDRIESAKAELTEHVKALLGSSGKHEESPITMYLPNLIVKFT